MKPVIGDEPSSRDSAGNRAGPDGPISLLIEPPYGASPPRVFAAWAEPEAQWFVGRQGGGARDRQGPRTSACCAMADDPCRFPGSPNDYLASAAIRRAMRRGYEVRLSGLSCGEGKNAVTKREVDTCTDERVAYNEAKELK